MREEIIAKARFLLSELHLSPTEASGRLKTYFPELEREERVRYLHQAHELAEGVASTPAAPPGLSPAQEQTQGFTPQG